MRRIHLYIIFSVALGGNVTSPHRATAMLYSPRATEGAYTKVRKNSRVLFTAIVEKYRKIFPPLANHLELTLNYE